MMDAAEIREALASSETTWNYDRRRIEGPNAHIILEAARVHAEWLEKGQEHRAWACVNCEERASELICHINLAEPGRYFVVPLGEETQP